MTILRKLKHPKIKSRTYLPPHGGYSGTVVVHQDVAPYRSSFGQHEDYNSFQSRHSYHEWVKERRALTVAAARLLLMSKSEKAEWLARIGL